MPVSKFGKKLPRHRSSGGAVWVTLFLLLAFAAGQGCALLPRPPGVEASAGATLTVLSGIVEVWIAKGAYIQTATDGMMLEPGDRVSTHAATHALLTFTDGSSVELEPETTVTVKNLTPGQAGPDVTLEQSAGTTWSRVVALSDASPRFVIETPTATAAVRGTLFETVVSRSPNGTPLTRVATYQGLVEVAGQGVGVTIGAGTFTEVLAESTPAPAQLLPPPRSRVHVAIHSPAWLLVVDPLGRSAGVVAPGVLANQIPRATADDQAAEPQEVRIPEPISGTYQVYLFGKGEGTYLVTARAETGDQRVLNAAPDGQVRTGARFVADLQIHAAESRIISAELSGFRPLLGDPLGKVPVPAGAAQVAQATSTALAGLSVDRSPEDLRATAAAAESTPTAIPTSPTGTVTPLPPTVTSTASPSPTVASTGTATPVRTATSQSGNTPAPSAPAIGPATPAPASNVPVFAPTQSPAPPSGPFVPVSPPPPTAPAPPTPEVVATFVVPAEGFRLTPTPERADTPVPTTTTEAQPTFAPTVAATATATRPAVTNTPRPAEPTEVPEPTIPPVPGDPTPAPTAGSPQR